MKFIVFFFLFLSPYVFGATSSRPDAQTQAITDRDALYSYGINDSQIFENVDSLVVGLDQMIFISHNNSSDPIPLALKSDQNIIFNEKIRGIKLDNPDGKPVFMFASPGKQISAIIVHAKDEEQYVIVGPDLKSIILFLEQGDER